MSLQEELTLEDEEHGKLFIGGLSWQTNQDSFDQYFGTYGVMVDSVIMKEGLTGKSRGFGFVRYRDVEIADEVLLKGPHILDGKQVDVKKCTPKKLNQYVKSMNDNRNESKVFLGGLPLSATAEDIERFFEDNLNAKVVHVMVMYDQENGGEQSGVSRGFGFVTFESSEVANRVCAVNYITMGGKTVELKMAQPKSRTPVRTASSRPAGANLATPPPIFGSLGPSMVSGHFYYIMTYRPPLLPGANMASSPPRGAYRELSGLDNTMQLQTIPNAALSADQLGQSMHGLIPAPYPTATVAPTSYSPSYSPLNLLGAPGRLPVGTPPLLTGFDPTITMPTMSATATMPLAAPRVSAMQSAMPTAMASGMPTAMPTHYFPMTPNVSVPPPLALTSSINPLTTMPPLNLTNHIDPAGLMH